MISPPKYIIALAHKESLKSTMKHKMGAVVFNRRGHVISVGHNRFLHSTNHRSFVGSRLCWSVHAEIDAIQQLSIEESIGNYIYIHRSNYRCAKPCEDCLLIINKWGIRTIFYSDEE